MRSPARLALFLILTMLFRTSAFAYSIPMEVAGGLSGNIVHASSDRCPDMDESIPSSAQEHHSSPSCQISCALGAAPALVQHTWQLPIQSHAVSVFVVPPLSGKDALPPDTPPPIV
ncbi:MAG: hypothetical protein C0406_07980 [Sideroxydans sp.]|nr:hypothetical protein [Sideroxydans sp.]